MKYILTLSMLFITNIMFGEMKFLFGDSVFVLNSTTNRKLNVVIGVDTETQIKTIGYYDESKHLQSIFFEKENFTKMYNSLLYYKTHAITYLKEGNSKEFTIANIDVLVGEVNEGDIDLIPGACHVLMCPINASNITLMLDIYKSGEYQYSFICNNASFQNILLDTFDSLPDY